jgi:ubiquinone/menaquinone biosynthesis C-methylase UbiE
LLTLGRDFADEYPNAQVIGTDISPIQAHWVPPNLRFEIEDASKPWTYPDSSFDFVHIRYLFGSIGDWTALFREAYRVLKPGGYIESYETSSTFKSDDDSVPEGSPMHQWGRVFLEASEKFGRSFSIIEDDTQQSALKEAGFVDLDIQDFKVSGFLTDLERHCVDYSVPHW